MAGDPHRGVLKRTSGPGALGAPPRRPSQGQMEGPESPSLLNAPRSPMSFKRQSSLPERSHNTEAVPTALPEIHRGGQRAQSSRPANSTPADGSRPGSGRNSAGDRLPMLKPGKEGAVGQGGEPEQQPQQALQYHGRVKPLDRYARMAQIRQEMDKQVSLWL